MCFTTSGTLHWNDGEQRSITQIIFYSKGQAIQVRQALMDCYPDEIVDRIVIDYTWTTPPNTITLVRKQGDNTFRGSATMSGSPTKEIISCKLYRRTDQEILLIGE